MHTLRVASYQRINAVARPRQPVGSMHQNPLYGRGRSSNGLGQHSNQPAKPQWAPQPCIGERQPSSVAAAAGGSSAVADRPQQAAAAKSQNAEVAAKAREAMQQKPQESPLVGRIWDLQASIKEKIAADFGLKAPETVFTDAAGKAVFSSDDAAMCFEIQVLQGDEKIMWVGAPRTMLGKLALGGRVNAFVSTAHSTAPNLDIEMYLYPLSGKLFMYLNLSPRRSLIEHPEDLQKFYLDTEADTGASHQALYASCEEKAKGGGGGWERFVSRDAFVRALTGGTCLMYQMDATEDNMAEMERLASQVHSIWTKLVQAAPAPKEQCEVEALGRTDTNLLGYSRRDPDIGKATAFLGEQGLEDMLALLCREDRIFQ